MDKLLYLLGPLGCAVMMVVCMAMMARGMRGQKDADQHDDDGIAALRAEVAELRAERDQQATHADG
jgi:hypothetical protein